MDTLVQRALRASESRYESAVENGSRDRALAAFDLAQWLLEAGFLRRVEAIGTVAWKHAIECLRATEGMPTAEVVPLFDAAALVLIEVRALTEGGTGVERTSNDLLALHERFRARLTVFNQHSLIPLSGPEGPVNPEELLRGRAAALQALLDGRPSDAARISAAALRRWDDRARGSGYHVRARALEARCLHACGERLAARKRLEELRPELGAMAAPWLEAVVDDLLARTFVGTGEEPRALGPLDEAIGAATRSGLALRWMDLMGTRAELLDAAGDAEEARASARELLFGPRLAHGAGSFPLPTVEGHRAALLRMRPVLATGAADDAARLEAALGAAVPPAVPARSRYRGRELPARERGEARRAQLHEQALLALGDFERHGTPFVLYLRKFDITVLHRAALLGPGLLEVGLYDLLPPSCNMLTIQSSDDISYTGEGIAFDRTVPALLLEHDRWEEAAHDLIGKASWIVSECLMLSEGVRVELEIIDRFGRHERTLLVLPHEGGGLPSIDGHPLVRRFPHAVWAHELNEFELDEIPFVREMLAELA